MRNLLIGYGNNCHTKTWTNKATTFDDLCLRLSKTIRTTESVEEYPKLPKSERDRIKDKGGFVTGQLRDNRRKRETIASRSMLTLDADHATTDLINSSETNCKYAACLYTTHGHTPEPPSARIIWPLKRNVTSDEYFTIARYFTTVSTRRFSPCSDTFYLAFAD